MDIDTKKVELIDWIAQLNDQYAIRKILSLKNKLSPEKKPPDSTIFGSGKHLVEFIADDFNDPIDIFEDYQK